jgi:hypothetical protein
MDTTPHPAAGRTAKPLRCTSLARGACIAFVTLAWPVLALADCVDTRKATAGEIEFHKRATATLLAALPPVPVAGKLQQKDSVMSLGQQCGPTGDFTVQASRGYEHNGRLAIVAMSINVQQLPAAASALSAAYGTASPGRSTGLKVHNVVWTVSGSDSPLRKTLAESIGRAHLQALVGRPLPTVAESEALAAQAVPATVTATAAAPSANAPAMQATGQPAAAPDPSMPAARQPGAAEPVRDAADAVNKLRGLFGR